MEKTSSTITARILEILNQNIDGPINIEFIFPSNISEGDKRKIIGLLRKKKKIVSFINCEVIESIKVVA